MNSTPTSCASIIRLTALPPPPPTPMTFMRACCAVCSSISKIMKRALAFSEEVLEPSLDRTEHLLDGRRAPSRGESSAGHHFLRPVEQEPHGHRHARRLDAVYQPGESTTGSADPHGEGEHLAGPRPPPGAAARRSPRPGCPPPGGPAPGGGGNPPRAPPPGRGARGLGGGPREV